MLFKILKLFGIDLPARMGEVRVEVEERFDLAKDSVEQAAQTAAVLALLFFLTGLAALSAFGVGLIALYSWMSSNYGQFYGLAAVGAVLLLLAIVMYAIATSRAKSWRGESASRVAAKKLELAQARAERVAAATAAFEKPALPAPQQPAGATAAGDLIEPLVWALSRTIKLPAMDGPAMDELFSRLQSSARGVADETVEGLVRAVRYGDRPHVFAALGGAMFVGWLLGRHNSDRRDAQ
jgi:Na+-transporting methylmalonyl-CoA/oxaloacetate decarboxylase gamma subunit